jgi:hypothetical protein
LYSKKVGFQPDFVLLLQHVMRADPEKGVEFATKLINDEMGQHLDLDRVSNTNINHHLFNIYRIRYRLLMFSCNKILFNKQPHSYWML